MAGNIDQRRAAENFSAARKKYRNAANSYTSAKREIGEVGAERRSAQRAKDSYQNDRINFEERLEQIRDLIGAIEGSGGTLAGKLGGTVPEFISRLNGQAKKANSSYFASIRCDSEAASNLEDAYGAPDVDKDIHLSEALAELKNEANRLENAIQELERKMQQLDERMAELTRRTAVLNDEIANSRRMMLTSAMDMQQIRKYL